MPSPVFPRSPVLRPGTFHARTRRVKRWSRCHRPLRSMPQTIMRRHSRARALQSSADSFKIYFWVYHHTFIKVSNTDRQLGRCPTVVPATWPSSMATQRRGRGRVRQGDVARVHRGRGAHCCWLCWVLVWACVCVCVLLDGWVGACVCVCVCFGASFGCTV